ncbi:LamG-like jellyroll fold domain-containing protein [Muribaculum intestinale]|uniref:LamG-like jellyroll fold domain-containing protein n=1 Tax=Muribaculum intestinale TaxID=1796646 RepID=UPI0026746D13|nr:LamG-like jellyroll fold domain-containing protein [Muribaculum intestinale]
MALSQADKNEMLNAIKAESQSMDELPVVASLDGITTLPAIRGTEVVSAPVSLLRKPADDAAKSATTAALNATNATLQANAARDAASQAATVAANAATQARDAATAANDATTQLQKAIESARRHPMVLVNDILGDPERVFADWSAAKDALAAHSQSDGDEYMSIGCVMIFRGPKGWESWQFIGDPDNDISDATKWIPFATAGTGSGSGYYNVTALHPLTTGYYTKATAVAKLAEADIDDDQKRGMIITFESAAGKWEDYRFIGTSLNTFTTPGAWEEYGSKNTVRSITVNGEKKTPDTEGNVGIIIDKVEIDDSLDPASTNPVQNGVVAGKLSELESGTLFGSEVIENDDGTVTVQLSSKSAVITDFTIPAGGGGGGESAGTKIVLNASLSASTIKEGGSAMLTWSYDHQFTGEEAGQSTGQKATVEIVVKRGIVTTYSETKQDVGKGTYTLDLTKYLLLGTSDIYITATATDPTTGKQQRKPAYVSIKVVSLSLSSSYNIAAGLAQGGYDIHDKVEIPYAVSGAGTKSVILYVDGVQRNLHAVTRSGTTNSNFTLDMAGLSVGRHTVQMVAEMEQDGLTLRSESIYFDILKRGSSAPFIGTKIIHPDGRIITGGSHTLPVIEAGQYEKCTFDFVAYDPSVVPATVELWNNGTLARTVSVPRTVQTYTNRFTEKGRQTLLLKLGSAIYAIYVDVAESGIDIGEAQYGLQFKLDAAGRSNDESPDDRAKWESNGISTTFENVDWGSSGWIDGALKLTNGALATIDYKPFATDVKSGGLTIEMTIRVSNIMDRTASVVSCLDKGKGLLITTSEASFRTGQTVTYTNEDDEQVTREIKLATNIVEGEWTKVALTIGTAAEDRLMQLYINGNRTGADIYDSAFSFRQDTPQEITIDSTEADIEIKSVRVYNRALNDDEELENRIVDCDTIEEMMGEFSINDILGDNGDLDLDKLRAQGKGVLRIVRKNMLDDVYETNNKKTDFLADVYFYSPLGPDYDFILTNCYIRIQGTSSTKYPSKNIRIYFTKGSEKLSMTGKNVLEGNKYRMRPGAVPVPIVCCKSDYSDSSMSLNTGWAKLFNDVMKELGLLTPPQRHQYEQSGNSLAAINVRTAIDGMPIDIFCAETADGENVYYGQYNFNNEKSKSGPVFGMEGVEGYTPSCPIALETLNNTSPVCLFSTKTDAELIEKFDNGAEVNYGIDSAGNVKTDGDAKWADLLPAQQQAIRRLHSWLRNCVPAGAKSTDLTTYTSPKFKAEIDQYFDKDFILTYYIDREYGLGVDQFVKNMILRTWDGLIWYITYYDGDTQLGKRNDCFLVYPYTTMRDTWDAEAGKYAMEGFDSVLWNLVLANLQDDLKRCATNYRSVMTTERVLSMLNDEQSGNWSDRAFNKSGYLKYIAPATRTMYGKVWPFIYALQGSNRSHRTYFIRNRFALLDAKYGTSNFTSDNIDLYMARAAGDAADTLRITANEPYAFGYGTNNTQNLANTGIVDAGDTATLDITGAYTVNDPLRVYGASRIKALDMTGAAGHLKNALDLGKCSVLRELDLDAPQGGGSTGWWLSIGNCRQLRKLSLRNQTQAKTGGSTSTALDLTAQTRLEELDARGTKVQSVNFAKGAPVTIARLPGTLTTLRLEYLSRLTNGGLTLETYGNVRTFIFDNCPGIGWEALLNRCSNVDRLRVTGIDREDDGTWLNKFMAMGGVDAEGNFTDTCALVGTVRLTKYIEQSRYEQMCAHFPELNIVQPEYTMIRIDNIADDASVTNLDNGTGYLFGNDYVMSGHLAAIFAKRHRVLAKVTRKPTTRTVRMANNDVTVNNPDGEMTYYPLHDANSNYYADAEDIANCTPAKLDGSEGDIMMNEPGMWKKGVNDYLNGNVNYCCYSSNGRDKKPTTPEVDILTLDDLKAKAGVRSGCKIVGKDTLAASYTTDSTYSVCQVDVSNHKRVRFPSVPGSSLVGSVFCDAAGNVIENIVVPTLSNKFEAGMYLIKDIPEGATTLNFSILNTAEFDMVVLSNSDKIEDMEPEWHYDEEHLCAVLETVIAGEKFRSCLTGGSSIASMTWTDFHYYSQQRGMQQIDAMMHSRIANLCYAFYGRRDMQEQCGAGSHTNARTIGTDTMTRGMQDTVGYEYAKAINPNVTNSMIENLVHQYAWFVDTDSFGTKTVTQVNNICCLGYVNTYGHKYEMMDGVDLPNDSGNAGKWRIWMPDGTTRYIKGTTSSGLWITGVWHGLYMDMVPTGTFMGSSSTYYTDIYYISTGVGRVVYRGYSSGYANGGVSYANASYDASNASTNVGSRLAFRGNLVKAQSVAAYKAMTEVA